MNLISRIKSGWKWLEATLNDEREAINQRTIIVPIGGGLDIQETDKGTLLALSSTGILGKGTGSDVGTGSGPAVDLSFIRYTPSGASAGWVQVNVAVSPGLGLPPVLAQMYVWGAPPIT